MNNTKLYAVILNVAVVSSNIFAMENQAQLNEELLSAIDNQNIDAVTELIQDQGADVNYRATNGFTPLFHALITSKVGINPTIQVLIDHGADLNARRYDQLENPNTPNEFTLLMHAVVNGNPALVKILLDHGADSSLPVYLSHAPRPFTALDVAQERLDYFNFMRAHANDFDLTQDQINVIIPAKIAQIQAIIDLLHGVILH